MGKIKDVLNSITKDEKNLSRSDSKATVASKTPRRASKASSQVTAESVATSASTAGGDSIEPDSKRLSTPNTTPVEVVDRRASFVEPLNSAVIPDTESQKVAAPITHNVIKHEEIEEITRKKEHDRHFHYVQHHIQPVHDKEVLEEVHHTQEAPVTAIHENITATAEDAAAYESLGAQFKDEVIHVPVEKKVIDHGEKVLVREHRHVHHVVQPVIEKETHERHRIHTTIPIHHVTHEAPIIQQSINHEPLQMDEFLKRGGSLTSGLTHTEIGQTILTDKRASGVIVPVESSEARRDSITKLQADVSNKLNI